MRSNQSFEKSAFKPEVAEVPSIGELERNATQHGDVPKFDDQTINLTGGSDMLVRIYHNGDSEYLRTFDNPSAAPEQPTVTPSYLNLHHERGGDGKVERTRLNDIFVPENQRGQGIGGNLLQAAEANAADHSAQEIYGAAPQDNPTRLWYEKRGYTFRPSSTGGEEVFKALT